MSVFGARRLLAATSVTLLLTGVLGAAGLSRAAAPPVRAAVSCPVSAAGRAAAAAAAQRCGARVLVADATDETSQTFANADGTFTWESSVRSRFARAAGGTWVAADATLAANADGTISPRASTFPMTFSGGGAAAPLIRAVRDGRELTLSWKGTLPQPSLYGNTATYAEVLPGVDLRVVAGVDGFAEHVVVKSRAAASAVRKLRLGLHGEGLSVRRDNTGGLRALDDAGHTVFAAGTPLMWDSSDRPARSRLLAAGRYNEAGDVLPRTRAVGLELAGGDILLSPDRGLLDDAAAVYPVVIDPTVVGARNHWTALSQSSPTTSYYDAVDGAFSSTDGTNGLVRVGLSDWQSPVLTMRSLFEMDTSGLQGKGKVTSATFRLAQRWSGVDCGSGPGAVGLFWTNPINSGVTWNTSWNLDGTGWLRQIGSSSAAFRSDMSGAVCGPNDVSFDITGYASTIGLGCCAATTLGLRGLDETNHNTWKRYLNNAANSPTLIVTYDATPVLGARSTVPATSCVTGSGRPVIGTLTPTLSATATDTEGQPLSATFEWWAVGGTAALGSATATGVASGGMVSRQIPGGQLAGGGSYQWRVTVSDGSTSATSGWCEFGTAVLDPAATGCPGSLTPGDLNGDGVRDRVIGDPKGGPAGSVYVIDGATGAERTLQEGADGVPGTVGDNDQFGWAVTVYDANRDGCADVAVSAPLYDYNGVSDSGVVYLLYGSPAGLARGPASMTIAQGVALPNGRGTVPDSPEAGDWFGHALSGGVTANGEPFLIIGAPGEDIGTASDTGTVHYLRGTVNVKFDGHSPEGPETDDRSGTSLASTPYQFGIGVPGEAAGPGTEFSGSVCVLNHNSGGTAPSGIRCFRQGDDTYSSDPPERGDGYGTSIAMVPYRQSGQPVGTPSSLLVVGVPGEDIGSVTDAGMVQEYLVTTTAGQHLGTVGGGTGGIGEGDQAGAYFGRQVVAANLSPDAEASPATVLIAVGMAGKDRGSVRDSGAVRVIGGGTNILTSSVLVERTAGALPGAPTTQELLGGWLSTDGTNLLVPSPWGNRAVYAIPWSGLASGSAAPARTYVPGQGGIPATAVAFGTAIG